VIGTRRTRPSLPTVATCVPAERNSSALDGIVTAPPLPGTLNETWA
jgi:hypothetical protein